MTARPALCGSVSEPTLYVAFELGKKDWKLAMTTGFGVTPWLRTVASGDWRRWSACCEGRGAVWAGGGGAGGQLLRGGARRVLDSSGVGREGIANRVVDSASIEVNRRARRAKTDRLDAVKLVTMLVRVCARRARRVEEVRVPTVAAEAARHVSRERTALTQEQTRLMNQMRSWLATWGAACRRAGAGSGGRRCAIGRARRCRRKCKRGSRAREARLAGSRSRSRRSRRSSSAAVTARRRRRAPLAPLVQ